MYQIPSLHPLTTIKGQLSNSWPIGWRFVGSMAVGVLTGYIIVSFILAVGLFYFWLRSIRSEKFYPTNGGFGSVLTVFSLRLLAIAMCCGGIWFSIFAGGQPMFASWSGMLAAGIIDSFYTIRNTRTQDILS